MDIIISICIIVMVISKLVSWASSYSIKSGLNTYQKYDTFIKFGKNKK